MGKDKGLTTGFSKLRSLAEERLCSENISAGPFLPKEESQRLLHELQVHQIELEMQNEELRRAYDELEKRVEERTAELAETLTALRKSEAQLKLKQKMLEEFNSTLEKRVQEEVTKNREKDIVLIQQNRQAALGEMLDHIAHQWKQPLNSIAIIIQALGSTSVHAQVSSMDILETVDSIMDMVGHMAQTVDVFRNFYRPNKEKSVFLVKDSIVKALSFVTPALMHYGIEVDLDADTELSAFGYPKEYAQVLLNILANANDVFRRGVEDPRINIKAFVDGDKRVVTITDNAGGIPDLSIERIFDLYFTTKESSGGTGVGLYMSKNIIGKNMGGRLSVCNVEQGAQFRIELGAR